MKTTRRAYTAKSDFLRVRDFLADSYALYRRPFNWLIHRWNFCRYFVVPVHTYYNVRYFGAPTRPHHSWRDELPAWEQGIALWENEAGEIVAVAHSENEEPGEAWLQVHPRYGFLYGEMIDYAEAHLADRAEGVGYVKLYVNDGSDLEQIAAERGYRRLNEAISFLEYEIGPQPAARFPQGFVLKSVAEEDDPAKRSRAKALAFGPAYAPSSWAPASTFQEMQAAPDYRKDLDLVVVAPNGDYAAFCTIWIDRKNRLGMFEPVGTHAEYQGMGLGRALLAEGFRRMAEQGATRSYMDSNNEFYQRVGFVKTPWSYAPWIKYFPV